MIDDIQIERVHRSTIQDSGDTTDDDELDLVFNQYSQDCADCDHVAPRE